MKKVMFFFAMLSMGTLCWAGSAREDATERLENATTVLHEIMGMPDKGIPEEVLEHAKCVAVVPHMVKGGFIFGGKGGKGVATCRTANGWSAPAFITISGGKMCIRDSPWHGSRSGSLYPSSNPYRPRHAVQQDPLLPKRPLQRGNYSRAAFASLFHSE